MYYYTVVESRYVYTYKYIWKRKVYRVIFMTVQVKHRFLFSVCTRVYVNGTRVNNIIIGKGILYEAHACQKRVCRSPRARKTALFVLYFYIIIYISCIIIIKPAVWTWFGRYFFFFGNCTRRCLHYIFRSVLLQYDV